MNNQISTYSCKYCGEVFTTTRGKFNAHCRLCPQNPKHDAIIQSLKKGGSRKCTLYNKNNTLPRHEYIVSCANCGKTFTITCTEREFSKKEKFFCSRACANRRTPTEESNKKRASTLYRTLARKNNFQSPKPLKYCYICGATLCKDNKTGLCRKHCARKQLPRPTRQCKNCGKPIHPRSKLGYCKNCVHSIVAANLSQQTREKLRIAALKSVANQSATRRSKNEIAFCELCKTRFNNVKNNLQLFNGWDADIILLDQKIAILWNGAWHYKQISTQSSLACIQNRDRIKIAEITKAGFTPYVIKDMGKASKTKVQTEFNKLITFIEHGAFV